MVVRKTTRRQDVRHWTASAGQQYNDANSDVRTDVDRTSTANDVGQSDGNPTDVGRKSDEKRYG
jgi:hypothetical protein